VIIFESFTIQTDTPKRKGLKNSKSERSRTGFVLLKDDLCRVEINKDSLFYSLAIKALVFGSFIKDFSRRGGKWARQTHNRYATVSIIDKIRSSQTCAFCYSQND
jgi:hypothetical protein